MYANALRGIRRRQPTGFQRSVNRDSHGFRNHRNRPGNTLLTTARIVYKHFAALVGRTYLWTGTARPTGRGTHRQRFNMEPDEPTLSNSGHDDKSTDDDKPANYAQACLARLPGHAPRVEGVTNRDGKFRLVDRENPDARLETWTPVDVEAVR